MALSLVATLPSHNQSNYYDLPSFLDPYVLEHQSDPQSTTVCNQLANSNSHHHQQQQQQQQLLPRSSKIYLTNFNNNTNSALMELNNNNNHNNTNNIQISGNLQQISTNISQLSNTTNRNLMNGFHHQHFGAEYEPVITFVDSPPNSEESWPDDQSKGSPGPQIIDVQTIYSNSGSRKRRMDWDPLEIGQSESPASAQTGELSAKISAQQLLDKEKYKKERLNTGRGTWGDDIGFDLNAEFNSNSYLNNESFMTFASGLPAALKQEPQSDQLKINKNSLNIHQDPGNISISTKNDKSPLQPSTISAPTSVAAAAAQSATGHIEQSSGEKLNKNDIIENHCILEQNSNTNKVNNLNNEQARNNSMPPHHQLLTVVDASKIEQIPGVRDISSTSNSDDYKFQYILAAATSIATKNNEDTLTYLNQGQSYEIKLKKIGDLSLYRDKILKSVIKICFHERRLQYMEREQMQQWQASRPGERIIEVDLPLSYGLCHVSQPLNPNYLNTVEILWDPMKEVGVYIKVNCISTEFTPKKHGGEKGVPFRLQIETYVESSNNNNNNTVSAGNKSPLGLQAAAASPTQAGNLTPNSSILSLAAAKQVIHAAACQIKVFKLKGADRKHKQDREKIQKRPQSEQDKFQPSYECTIMTDIPLDLITPSANNNTNGCFSPEYMKIWPNSPVHMPKYDGIIPFNGASPNANNASPIAINSVSSTNSTNLKIMDPNSLVTTPAMVTDIDEYNSITIMPESTPAQVTQWLTYHRLTTYLSTFAHFSGADIMRMSKEDLIQICGLADGIRMFNILRVKSITPRLTIYISLDGNNYNAVYLISNTSKELLQKLFKLPGFYEIVAKSSSTHNGNNPSGNNNNNNMMDNSSPFHSWGNIQSKYSGSGSNIYNEVNSKSLVYVTGPAGIHVAVTDEVLNNEIRDGSLYGLEVQNGKIIMKLKNKNEI
ncbi:transcription factor CP2 like gemini [Cochliomyia hominivorax]